MRRAYVLALSGWLTAAGGCVLTSGQFVVTYEDFPNPVGVVGFDAVYGQAVDLHTNADYEEHKDKVKGLLELALVGEFTNNNGGSAVDIEIWLTPGSTSYVTTASLRVDPTAVQVWGPLHLAPGETRRLGWDDSAALLSPAGRQAVFSEAKGDGAFTLYLLGSSGTYNFMIRDPALILVLDVGL
jgi:hypothetical protein